MKTETENSILKNLLAEALRVYDVEVAVSSAGQAPRPDLAAAGGGPWRAGSHAKLASADLRTENGVLRNLLAATAEAYEKRLEAFRAEKELVRHVLAATQDAVLTTDASGAVTSMNPAAEELTGWSLEEVRGRSLREVLRLAEASGAGVELDLAPCLADGGQVDLPPRLEAVHRDGRRRPASGHAAAIHDRLRGVLGAVVILRHGASAPCYEGKAR